jgi:hypothetical protein
MKKESEKSSQLRFSTWTRKSFSCHTNDVTLNSCTAVFLALVSVVRLSFWVFAAIELKSGPTEARNGRWTLLNHYHPVCFEGQGNRYGFLVHVGKKGLVGAIKLVYRSGSIR